MTRFLRAAPCGAGPEPGTAGEPGTARIVGTVDAARAHIGAAAFDLRPPGLVGVELEWLTRTADGRRPDASSLAAALGPHAPSSLSAESPQLPMPCGSVVTVEPGGQVELSSVPHTGVADLRAALEKDARGLRGMLARHGIAMTDGAVDADRAPQRILPVARYAAMQERFERAGPFGAVMMCNTAAIHVSVDCGADRQDLALRWRMLNAVGPALVAAFADTTAGGWASERMRTWLTLDPARTGMDPAAPGGEDDPVDSYIEWALDAPLLCVRRPHDDWTVPGDVSFRRWIAGGAGAPDRAPTVEDLDYHLTTLFPPVRPCGRLEVRYIDAQPAGRAGGWCGPVAAVDALARSPETARRALAIAGPTRGWWRRAAVRGLADGALRDAAAALLELAAEQWAAEQCDAGQCGAEPPDGGSGRDGLTALHRHARRCRAG